MGEKEGDRRERRENDAKFRTLSLTYKAGAGGKGRHYRRNKRNEYKMVDSFSLHEFSRPLSAFELRLMMVFKLMNAERGVQGLKNWKRGGYDGRSKRCAIQ